MEKVFLRQLNASDWPDFKALRLTALKSSPGVFSGTFEDAFNRSDEGWQSIIAGNDRYVCGLFDGETLVGIAGIFTDLEEDPTGQTAVFGMGFILPAYRGKAFAHQLFEARLAWARAQPHFRFAHLAYRASNAASASLAKRYGFIETGQENRLWPDGTNEIEVICKLNLIPST